jgi:hypothetical protein
MTTKMNFPVHFEVVEGIAYYHPAGKVSFGEAMALGSSAIATCRENGIRKLLINATKLTGLKNPSTFERYQLSEQLADHASGVMVAFVAPKDMIDSDHFGIIIARNKGMIASVFSSEPHAQKWLRDLIT